MNAKIAMCKPSIGRTDAGQRVAEIGSPCEKRSDEADGSGLDEYRHLERIFRVRTAIGNRCELRAGNEHAEDGECRNGDGDVRDVEIANCGPQRNARASHVTGPPEDADRREHKARGDIDNRALGARPRRRCGHYDFWCGCIGCGTRRTGNRVELIRCTALTARKRNHASSDKPKTS